MGAWGIRIWRQKGARVLKGGGMGGEGKVVRVVMGVGWQGEGSSEKVRFGHGEGDYRRSPLPRRGGGYDGTIKARTKYRRKRTGEWESLRKVIYNENQKRSAQKGGGWRSVCMRVFPLACVEERGSPHYGETVVPS